MDTQTTPTPKERRFPCAQCGAALEYAPGSASLECPYCRHANPVPEGEGAVEELDYRATLDALGEQQEGEACLTVRCDACGAEMRGLGHVTALPCSFCGTPIVATEKSCRLIKPKAILPFTITRAQGEAALAVWLKGLWFAPGDLRRYAMSEGRLAGVYIPAWTYDCLATSDYRGQRGDAYYVQVPYTTSVKGRTVTMTRTERRIRWSPRSGRVLDRFDDVLVLAGGALPGTKARALEPWDLKALVPYRDEYLSGFAAESYRVGLADGFSLAQHAMEPVIRATVRADIGGDEQQIDALRTRHDDISFKHILLPIWMNAYRYRGRVYRFLINGRTGEVQGERPWSAWKIAGLVALGVVVALIVVLVLRSRG